MEPKKDRSSTKRPILNDVDAINAPAKIQKTELPDVNWSIGKYIKSIVMNNTRARMNEQAEMMEWLDFLKNLYIEWTRRKYNYEIVLEGRVSKTYGTFRSISSITTNSFL